MEVRIGGIYALERIAQDSPKDHWSVMEVLTALIRERSRSSDGEMVDRSGDWKASPLGGEQRDEEGGEEVAKDDDTWRWPPQHRMAEVQAALTVIGRRDREPEEDLDRRLDLAAADLRDADLANCNLDRTNFTGADLRGANLSGASVQDCTMVDTDFTGAVLWDTDLSESVLQGADFSETVLGGETTFDGVYFGNVQGLSPNDLEKLEGYEEAELPEEWKEKVDAEQSES